jgi:hypothetical protein
MATFNILHGFTEALVRGMRSSFLTDADYHHLTQCETLDDVKLNLSESDYGDALADMGTLIPTGLQKAAVEKVSFQKGESLCLFLARVDRAEGAPVETQQLVIHCGCKLITEKDRQSMK